MTGGAGFIGSAFIRYLIKNTSCDVLNVDKLTYSGNLLSLAEVAHSDRYRFSQSDIIDKSEIETIFSTFRPNIVVHFAAESHVDRSIEGPANFIASNIVGTFTLLEVARDYWQKLPPKEKQIFRFHHVSTDEVYGDLNLDDDQLFTETTPYAPSSPYSASKASSDHLVRSWHRTYGLPTVITNCSNNYGPYHHPEKLIPKVIINAIQGKQLPIYGKGQQVRDRLYVEDHVRALYLVATQAKIGETYNIGGHNEKTNLTVVQLICDLLEKLAPEKSYNIERYRDLIGFIKDRPGHDLRYAIDASKIEKDIGWKPAETFETGIEKTVLWYLENKPWWNELIS